MRLHLVLLSCIAYVLGEGVAFDDAAGTVRLSISQGQLLGKRIDAYDNRTGYGFLGIPFGAPAVGALRFAKPVPAAAWEGVRDVTVKGDACAASGLQTYKRPEGGPMSEDCLHMYVYSSKNCLLKGGCPIMWVLHGGGFNMESPVVFNDEVIAHNFASDGQDVVVIIPAFRLKNFGFLNIAPGLNTSAVPNVGFWDVLLAMQWTQREARHFGGDAKKITLYGHSAGAQFANMISLSPHFAGLFRAAVVMSGPCPVQESGPVSIETANSKASWASARLLGCADEDTNPRDVVEIEEVIACLRAKTWQEIVAANERLNSTPEDYTGPHADGPGGLLPLPLPELALKRRATPMLIGTLSAEMRTTKYCLDADGAANLAKVTELCRGYIYGVGYEHPETLTERCVDHYMQGKNVKDFVQDIGFFMTTFVTARDLTRKGAEIFLYSFTYKGVGRAFNNYNPNLEEDDHPTHSEDFVYFLGMHRANFTPKDYEIEKIYSGMVLNFVRDLNPNGPALANQPKWRPFTNFGRDYYEIDFDDKLRMPGMKRGYQAAAAKMWVEDAKKYGGPIAPPSSFPVHNDQFAPNDMIASFASHHANKSLAHDKSMEAEVISYNNWMEWISEKRSKHLFGLDNYRAYEVDEPVYDVVIVREDNNMIMELLLIGIFVGVVFLLIRCALVTVSLMQKRQGYEQF